MTPIRPDGAWAWRRASQFLVLLTIHATHVLAAELRPPGLASQSVHAGPGYIPVPDLKFTRLTTSSGLSQSNVTAILQDRRGFMWFATRDGLNRYDGNTFVVYKSNPDDPGSLSANFVEDLLEDDRGNLWIATRGGVSKFDPTTERFTRYRHDPENRNSLGGDSVTSIARDSHGRLWFATAQSGLDKFDPATGTFTHYRNDSDGLFVERITHVIEDRHQDIWFVGDRGLFHLNPDTGQITRPPATRNGLSADCVYEDGVGNFWMLAFSPIVGLVKYDRQAERLTRYPVAPGATGVANSRLLADGQHGLWVPSSVGLYYFDRQTERFQYRLEHDETNPDSLSDSTVVSAYRDRGGVLWVGTEDDGLNILNWRQGQFTHYRHRAADPNGLSAGKVTAVHAEPNGILWVGYFPRALDRLDRRTGKIKHYTPGPQNESALGEGSDLNSIYRDARGRLWLGGWGSGLDRFDERAGQFKHYRHDPADPNSLISNDVVSLYGDQSGQLWVGHRAGASRLDPATERFTNYRADPGKASYGSSAEAFCRDRTGMLWVGRASGVLSLFEDKTQTFVDYEPDSRDPHKLQGSGVTAIHEDRTGRLWLGGWDGLYELDRRNGRFTRYTEAQGLPSSTIQGILEDTLGRLWLGTKSGISRFDPRTGAFKNYDVSDGLLDNVFSPGAHAQSPDGEMFFGGANGITALVPENVRDDAYVPPVVITSFKIFNEPVAVGARSVLRKAIPYVDSITLSHEDKVFSLEFAALSYANSHRNRYRYKLERFDRGWNEVGSTQRLATYTNLDPGNYVFRVQGSNSDGVWNEEGASLSITVTPALWATVWFRTLCAAALGVLLFSAYRLRVRIVERHAAEIDAFNERLMKAQEQERTRIAGELHDSVMQQITALSLVLGTAKRKMASAPSPEAKEMVADVQRRLIDLGGEVRQLSHDLHPPMLKEAGLPEVLRGYCDEFGHSRGIPVSCDAEESLAELSPGTALALYRIAQEALGNAAKHAAPTRVKVRLVRVGGDVVLTVADDGRGSEPRRGSPGGLGLVTMRERARQLGGTFELDSRPGHGTTVRVAVPFRIREAKPPRLTEARE